MAWNLIIILHLSHTHLFFMKWESARARVCAIVCLFVRLMEQWKEAAWNRNSIQATHKGEDRRRNMCISLSLRQPARERLKTDRMGRMTRNVGKKLKFGFALRALSNKRGQRRKTHVRVCQSLMRWDSVIWVRASIGDAKSVATRSRNEWYAICVWNDYSVWLRDDFFFFISCRRQPAASSQRASRSTATNNIITVKSNIMSK